MEAGDLVARLGLKVDKDSFERGEKQIEKLREMVKHIIEVWIVDKAYEGLKHIFEGTMDAAIANKNLAERLQTTTEAVQELGYVAEVTGSSADRMASGMQRLSRQLERAKSTGQGPLVDAFNQLHINFKKFYALAPDKRFEALADAFEKAGPKVNKTAIAMELFRDSSLVPALDKGGAGVRALREEFIKLGGIVDTETTEKFEELERTQKRLKVVWGSIKDELSVRLLPVIKDLAERVLTWAKNNRELIAVRVKEFAEKVIAALGVLATAVGVVVDAVHVLFEVLDFLSEHSDAVIAALTGIAVVLGILAVEFIAVNSLAIACGIALVAAWVAAALPFIAIGVAVAAITYAIIKLIKRAGGIKVIFREIGEFISDIAGDIRDAFVDAMNWIERKVDAVWAKAKAAYDWIQSHVIEPVKDAGHVVFGGIDADVQKAFAKLHPGQAAATASAQAAISKSTVNQTNHITINALGAKADEVAKVVDTKLADLVRNAHSTTGGQK